MFKLFSGSANTKLTEEVSQLTGLPLARAEVVRFGNSEVKVTIQEEVKNKVCIVIQPTSNPTDTHLNELFFFCDALRRQEAKKVIGIIPYFGYARQDIQHREGECISATVVVRFLETIGFYKIYTMDIHDEATQGVFSIPYKNISTLKLLAENVKKYLKNDVNNCKVISPDQGGIERARKFGECFFSTDDFSLGVIEKKRNLEKIHTSTALDLYGDVQGQTVILVDDLFTSGGTLMNAAELCLQKGAQRVLAVVVHHDFAQSAPQKLQKSKIEKLFTTNTIRMGKDQQIAKIEEISIAPLIAEELNHFIK